MRWFILVPLTVLTAGCPDDPATSDDQSMSDVPVETQDDTASETQDDTASETQDDTAPDSVAPGDSDTQGPECTIDSDCNHVLAGRTSSPPDCAESVCHDGACRIQAVDGDGDGYRVAGCLVDGTPLTGDDCDDAVSTFFPGQTRSCAKTSAGAPIAFPGGSPQGSCRLGSETCVAGDVSACEGAVGPKAHDTCVAGNDDDCDGVPNGVQCSCVPGTSEACGTCGTGTRTCLATTDGATWGECEGVSPPAEYGAECSNECFLGTVGCQAECIAPAPPENFRESCGNRCHQGEVNCQGACTALPEPGNYGANCSNACGTGAVGCNGCTAPSLPPNHNADCGSCGGKINCQGQCSIGTPANYNVSCGSCGGRINCQGQCSVATPSNFGHGCGSCGGTINCQGLCSIGTPSNLHQSCNNGCGQITCSGACSAPHPSGWGQVSVGFSADESFTCCWLNYTKTYTASCGPGTGYVFDHVTVEKLSGGGLCVVTSQPAQGSNNCSVTVRFENQGTDGASCRTRIHRRRVCN